MNYQRPEINFALMKIKSSNYIHGDEEQLHRVFINLIKNSIESIYEKGIKMLILKEKLA